MVLPCGQYIDVREDETKKEKYLDHLVETNYPICTEVFLEGERKKRNLYDYEPPPPKLSCPINPAELCST